MPDPPAPSGPADASRVDGLYRALIALRVHHDRMLWSRVQILIAVQGAIIAGSYASGDHEFASLFLLGGSAISFVLYLLVSKDLLDRDANNELIDALGTRLIPRDLAREFESRGRVQPHVRFSADPPKWRPFEPGRYLIRVVIWPFILLDIALAVLHLLGKAPVVSQIR